MEGKRQVVKCVSVTLIRVMVGQSSPCYFQFDRFTASLNTLPLMTITVGGE